MTVAPRPSRTAGLTENPASCGRAGSPLHRVPLPGARTVDSSFYGTGQRYEEHLNAVIDSVVIPTPAGPLRYRGVRQVESRDSTQLERHLTPDFLLGGAALGPVPRVEVQTTPTAERDVNRNGRLGIRV